MTFIQQIQQYWAIIVFTGGVIASWVRYELMIKDLRTEVDKIKVRNELKDKEYDVSREGILIKLSSMETSLKFILEAINKIKN